MRSSAVVLLFILATSPVAVSAQQTKPNESGTSPVTLNDTQLLGRRLFRQRCGICHTEPAPGFKRYAPALYKELIIGNEDTIREFIANGSKGKMPGFKYGLEPAEINAIVEYLKTVPRIVKKNNSTGGTDTMD